MFSVQIKLLSVKQMVWIELLDTGEVAREGERKGLVALEHGL